jgi:Uma2 family endonuclease
MSIVNTDEQILEVDEKLYPSGDGKPMAETFLHVKAIMLLFQAVEDVVEDDEETYVCANMFWYYEEGNPKARRAPDVMVVKGVGRRIRNSYFTWLENGRVPCVIFEVVSPNKRRADLKEKPPLYAKLGVHEYFCFDPTARPPKKKLQGWRLNLEGVYEPLELDDQGRLFSQELGLYMQVEGDMLRLIDAATGKPILTRAEKAQLAEVETHRANLEKSRADAEKHRADAEKHRADAEKNRADALEREIAALKAQKNKNGGAKRNNGS